MTLFFSLFREKKEREAEGEERKEKRPNRRGKRLASTFIILLLISSTFSAGYASASFFGDLKEKTSNFLHKHAGAIAVGVTAGCLILTGGAGSYGCLAAGAATYVALQSSGGNKEKKTVSTTSNKNATTADLEDDKDVVDNTAKALDDTQQAAYKQIAELNAMLSSNLTKYDYVENGSTGDLWARVYAPQKIYGYSAFPVQIYLKVTHSNIPFSVVHLRTIKVYLKATNSSTALWTRTWDYGSAGSEGLNGEEVVYSTILKVPDPYAYQVKQMLDSGQVNKDLIMQIFNNATTKSWEIFVDISAYREIWQSDPQYTDQSSCEAQPHHKWDSESSTCYEFVRNADIDYHIRTTSAWKHVTMANDLAILNEGMYASLPVKFAKTALKSKWSLYQESFTGAVSDFIILTYASPVHVMDSTVDYKFYIAPNKGYFDPLNVTFNDDFRFFTVRVNMGGSWELANTIFGHLGDVKVLHHSNPDPQLAISKKLNAKYSTASDILTYEPFGIVYFTINRKDGQKIPIWEIVWPKVSVEPNTHTVMDDTQIQQLVTLVNQSKLDNNTLSQLKSDIQAMVNGLNDKLQTAQAIEKNAEGVKNTQAAGYAKKAEMAYKYAIDALNHAASSNDKQTILNYLNAAKKYEQAGDFYMSAAKKALYGAPEQAKLDAQMGDHLSNLASQYEPHIDVLGTAKNALSRKVKGIPLWVLLVIIFALAGAFVIWKKLL